MIGFITYESEVTRNNDGLSISVDYSLKLYSDQKIVTENLVIDEHGNTAPFDLPAYDEADLLQEKKITYVIPDADQTMCCHRDEHPHNLEEELEFQEKSTKWLEDVFITNEWIAAFNELATFLPIPEPKPPLENEESISEEPAIDEEMEPPY